MADIGGADGAVLLGGGGGDGGAAGALIGATAATLSGAASTSRRLRMGVGTLVPLHFPIASTPHTRAK